MTIYRYYDDMEIAEEERDIAIYPAGHRYRCTQNGTSRHTQWDIAIDTIGYGFSRNEIRLHMQWDMTMGTVM